MGGEKQKSQIPAGADASALRSALLSHVSSVGQELKPKIPKDESGQVSGSSTKSQRPPMTRDPSALPTPFPEGASTVDYMTAPSHSQHQQQYMRQSQARSEKESSAKPEHSTNTSSSAAPSTKPTQQVGFNPQSTSGSGPGTGTTSPNDGQNLMFPLTSPPSPQLHARKSFGQQTGHTFNLSGMSQVINSTSSSGPNTPGTPATPGSEVQTPASSTSSSRRNSMRGSLSRNTSFKSPGSITSKPDFKDAKIIVAMVGLPARGKSYLSNKLMRYLKWLEYDVKVFNAGQLRRSKAKTEALNSGTKADHSAGFFDRNNANASQRRDALASECLEALISWLKAGGNVGIHDATNSTRRRRAELAARVRKERGFKLLFLESVCDDPAVIDANIAIKVSSGDPDYDGIPKEKAEEDFRKRIKLYERSYETIDSVYDADLTYAKIINVGKQVVVNRIDGYLQSRIAFYLMNLHLAPRAIYLTRHGESQHNVEGKIGGDSSLSVRGEKYATALPALIKDKIGDVPLEVWTSTLKRTAQTARHLHYPLKTWKALDELDAGVCDDMTYEQIAEMYPEDYAARDDDKYNYRYRGGESYRDVVVRLEPVIMELERQGNILLVCHQAIIRCLYAYFNDLSPDDLPYIKIPLHTVIKLTPRAYGCEEERFTLPIEAVDTTRPKPIRSNSSSSRATPIQPIPSSSQPRDWSSTM